MTEREVQDIIDEVDENKDGKLDYQEVMHQWCLTRGTANSWL